MLLLKNYLYSRIKITAFFFTFVSLLNPLYAGNDDLNEEIEEIIERRSGVPILSQSSIREAESSSDEEIETEHTSVNTSTALQLSPTSQSQPSTTNETQVVSTVVNRRRPIFLVTAPQYYEFLENFRASQYTRPITELLSTPAVRFIYQRLRGAIISEALSSMGLPAGVPSLPWRANSSQPLSELSETSNQGENLRASGQPQRSLVISLPNIPFLPPLSFTIQDPVENRRLFSKSRDDIFSTADEDTEDDILFFIKKAVFNVAHKTSEIYEQYYFLTFFYFFFNFIKIFH